MSADTPAAGEGPLDAAMVAVARTAAILEAAAVDVARAGVPQLLTAAQVIEIIGRAPGFGPAGHDVLAALFTADRGTDGELGVDPDDAAEVLSRLAASLRAIARAWGAGAPGDGSAGIGPVAACDVLHAGIVAAGDYLHLAGTGAGGSPAVAPSPAPDRRDLARLDHWARMCELRHRVRRQLDLGHELDE
ncbi:MAG: hypothetical protein ACT4RN_07470 [Pseudonocardia sp.]